jgi:hypothetical protein
MNTTIKISTLALALALTGLACGPGETTPEQDTGTQADTGDTSDAGGGSDAGASDADTPDVGDGGGDAGATCDPWPTPRLGEAASSVALAAAPARCGQDAHAWLDPAPLATPTAWGTSQRILAGLIRTALSAEGIDLGDRIAYDTFVEQYTYTTQDRGETIEATALLARPTNADAIKGTLLVLHGTTGFMDDCAPSSSAEGRALVALFASFGYVVVAPDYIGLKGMGDASPELHPYLVGQATAIASLDALRALGKMEPEKLGGLCPPTEYLTFGGSQGGHAALWVDRLAPHYAPELEHLGVVATVPPANLIGQMERALVSPVNATANTIAFLATASQWYDAEDQLDTAFASPYDVDVPAALADQCDPSDQIDLDATIEELFVEPLYGPAREGMLAGVDPWGCITSENGIATTSVERIPSPLDSYGILTVFGSDDNLVDTPTERDGFQAMCDQDLPLEFVECAGASHGGATLWAIPEILEFLDARLAREPFAATCGVADPITCGATPAQ